MHLSTPGPTRRLRSGRRVWSRCGLRCARGCALPPCVAEKKRTIGDCATFITNSRMAGCGRHALRMWPSRDQALPTIPACARDCRRAAARPAARAPPSHQLNMITRRRTREHTKTPRRSRASAAPHPRPPPAVRAHSQAPQRAWPRGSARARRPTLSARGRGTHHSTRPRP